MKGAYLPQRGNGYFSKIMVRGKTIHLGAFPSAEQAATAYEEARSALRPAKPRTSTRVQLHKPTGKYRAFIVVDGRQRSLGLYETPDAARLAHT